ncbi:MAG TPA: Fic family protein, partial [Candidatus Krumholzibacteria bacterium]|nr:Fic family protein [Candidatus Krumholzibacteria bacterium]
AVAESKKMADLLEKAKSASQAGIVRSALFGRTEREALERAGWLRRIIRGWYLLRQPTDPAGETTAWYSSFWDFVAAYLRHRLGDQYCLSAESSLDLRVSPTRVPKQVIAIAGRGGSTQIELPEQTSLLTYEQATSIPPPTDVEILRGIRVMSLPLSLIRVAPAFFQRDPDSAEIAMRLLGDPSELIRVLLAGPHVSASERLAGAFLFLGEDNYASRIQAAMEADGHRVRPANPFNRPVSLLAVGTHLRSPYGGRVEVLWTTMRDRIVETFDIASGPTNDTRSLLQRVEALQGEDAYHSLSIEGYQVTPELIQKIRDGSWDPDSNADSSERNALAAKGYHEAYAQVVGCIQAILGGAPPGVTVSRSIQGWYTALFSPSVKAGLLTASDLAGYRSAPVFIRGARHVPPPREALADAMDTFEGCLSGEASAVVRAILGHFIFVWIHPFQDGNGRIARFLMNTMLATGGYPWTVLHVENRDRYMASLDSASSDNDIVPFVEYVASECRHGLDRWRRASTRA